MPDPLSIASLAIPLAIEGYKLVQQACSKLKTNKYERLLLLSTSQALATEVDNFVKATAPSQALKKEVDSLVLCV